MDIELVKILHCPSCRCAYQLEVFEQTQNRIESAVLLCPSCQLLVPICFGMPLFAECRPYPSGSIKNWLMQLRAKLFGEEQEYVRFIQRKSERKVTDLYAAFQPFNESTRSIYPFLQILRKALKPGDIILDTWCRTGWSGELLAGLFPEQRIISLWEGDSNVLGYKGFQYWLNSSKRASNLDIVFTHADSPLPFATDSVAFVHGLDSIHRYLHSSFIPECLRVCKNDGVLIFPHIHLSNNEPDPFFERGCKQYHGADWKTWLDKLLENSERQAFVLPETGLFELTDNKALSDDCNTEHYNGLIFIVPNQYANEKLSAIKNVGINATSRFIENPLLNISIHQCVANKTGETLAGLGAELLLRHPCYQAQLDRIDDCTLTQNETRFIWHAEQLLSLHEIAQAMHLNLLDATKIAHALCEREILHAACVSESMAALQQFYGKSKLTQKNATAFTEIWNSAGQLYNNKPLITWLEDDSEISFEDADYLVQQIRCKFIDLGIQENNRIAIAGAHHPFFLLICWAAWLNGITVVSIDKEMPFETITRLLIKSETKIVFTDQSVFSTISETSCVMLNDDFAEWLDAVQCQEVSEFEINSESIAVILFTSGSTGEPKGVMLSQKALAISGQNMAQTHSWLNEVLFSLGPFSMMSGLRNPAVAALCSGSSILLPGSATSQHPWLAWQQACQQHVTVITAVPSWLQMVMSNTELQTSLTLKTVLLTGSPLSPALRAQAKQRLNCGIGNYYGLTETGGLCAAQLTSDDQIGETIGIPAGAIIQIVDSVGVPVQHGEPGILRCFSEQLMTGYLGDAQATDKVLQDGWFSTGDIARWDEIGRIQLLGRNDDFLKLRNGALFNPNEVEACIAMLDGVRDVAVTVDAISQRVIAFVVSELSAQALHQQLSEQFSGKLMSYQLPERWIATSAIPKNTNGKIIRKQLQEMLNAQL